MLFKYSDSIAQLLYAIASLYEMSTNFSYVVRLPETLESTTLN
jgi:hypothetical protein